MNLSDITALATKPVAAVSAKPLAVFASVMNTPIKTRPIYLQTVVDALTGYTLEDAVAGKIVVITGASAGIGETTARPAMDFAHEEQGQDGLSKCNGRGVHKLFDGKGLKGRLTANEGEITLS